ncbi:cytochrome c biogenesis CcdA family protein [Kitasatospora sp. NPDC091207]|uniref:cytochrome c biogenesis CcdA family protein n=1 Tax=Kitasatospora sp. NPDC091207 TaxID=3364083 RepID=UPI00380395D6
MSETARVVLAFDGSQTIFSGALVLAIPVAMLGGLVSFLSPCVLPLVPGYLSYVTGFSAADLADAEGRKRGRVLLGAALFVAGFTIVFVSTGALFGSFGYVFQEHQRIIQQASGVFAILMGLTFAGLLPKFAQREFRLHRRPIVGLIGAPVLGVVFGVGWTPCLGPTLSAVQVLAMEQASAGRGALLSAAYCVGLGLPFLVTAVAFRGALGAFGWVKRHYLLVMRLGGGMLVLVGALLLTGAWDQMIGIIREWASDFDQSGLVSI